MMQLVDILDIYYYYCYYIRLTAFFFQDNSGRPQQKGKSVWILLEQVQEMMGWH